VGATMASRRCCVITASIPSRPAMRTHFARNEEMRTEISTKFTRERLDQSYADAGLEIVEWWTDPDDLYALSLAKPVD